MNPMKNKCKENIQSNAAFSMKAIKLISTHLRTFLRNPDVFNTSVQSLPYSLCHINHFSKTRNTSAKLIINVFAVSCKS